MTLTIINIIVQSLAIIFWSIYIGSFYCLWPSLLVLKIFDKEGYKTYWEIRNNSEEIEVIKEDLEEFGRLSKSGKIFFAFDSFWKNGECICSDYKFYYYWPPYKDLCKRIGIKAKKP